jgi:iron complex outermembrane recepter protein
MTTHPLRWCWPLLAALQPALAQTDTVLITGNPLGRDSGAAAVSSLTGPGLQLKRAATLGDTLAGLPGVASSGFGPNAGRPVIRGLDGDRVRLLDNGSSAVDASNLSFDHAVALDPLVAERIEVLRGPAALLYGGNATGGVVNVIDNRIPREPIVGLTGRAELRGGGAARERAGSAVVEGGAGGFAWHADAFSRRHDDQRTPRYTPLEDGVALEPTRRVRNSAAEARGGAVGAGWAGSSGHAGLAVDTLRHDYGVTVEPDVTIRLERERVAAAGEWRAAGGLVRSLNLRAGHTRYQHQEVEGDGAIGTTFASRGSDLRAELRHAPVLGLEGVVGLQAEKLRFSALGDEAFVPGTQTRQAALFVFEEWRSGGFTLSGGLRAEQVRVASDGDAADAPAPRFGAAQSRRFEPLSASFGAAAALGNGWQLQATLGHTERAPAYYELYANGLHLATAAFEVGDPALAVERSRHAELGIAWSQGTERRTRLKASLFTTRFSNHIALDATGNHIDVAEPGDPPELVPEYRFQGVRARLTGFEIEGRTRLFQGAWTLDATAALDAVRGSNLTTAQPLPRIAPLRARLGLELGQGAWQAGAELRHHTEQKRFGAFDTPTVAYTMLDLTLRADWPWQAQRGIALFAKLSNATDELGFNAASVATVRGLTPYAGRALSAGLNVRW